MANLDIVGSQLAHGELVQITPYSFYADQFEMRLTLGIYKIAD